MKTALITGSGGLIGSECVRFFSEKGFKCIGIDNNMRKEFFGETACVLWNIDNLKINTANYEHHSVDIRENDKLEKIFKKYSSDIKLIIHTAAQPSHDWAAKSPITDFGVNAVGTINLLENFRKFAEKSVFIFTSTNKVYGDTPNKLPLKEIDKRWEIDKSHNYYNGIDETMSIDRCKHSVFGASKVAADIMVQEYGQYFNLHTGVFRGGCLTGPNHSGAELHGFLSYLVKCIITDVTYNIFGYKGKQVRDNIHSYDLVNMFWHFYMNPRCGEVYNAGGGRHSNCSIIEAIEICEELTGKKMKTIYKENNRIGDHVWWISSLQRFQEHYPKWNYKYSLKAIIEQIIAKMS